jgi:hypothetical protein
VLWLAAAREGLDDDQAATAAGAWTRQYALLVGGCGVQHPDKLLRPCPA